MNKKVASIAISASLVAGGVSIPVTLVYGQTLPKTTIEYSGKYDITDGEQALNQNTQNKLFNINVKYIYNNKVIKNETQKVNYNGSVNINIPNGYKKINVSGTDNNIQSDETVVVNITPITYKINYYIKYNGSYLKEESVEATQKGIGNPVNLIKNNIPDGYEFSSATMNGKSISESDLQNVYASTNSSVVINVNKKTYNFKYAFKDSNGSVIKDGNLTYQIGNSIVNLTNFVPKGYQIVGNNNFNNYNMFGNSSVNITVAPITHNINWKLVNSLTQKEINSGTKKIDELNGNFNASNLIPKGYIYVASRLNGIYSTLNQIQNISNNKNSDVIIAVEEESNVGLVTTKTNNSARTATITYNDPNAKSISLVVGNQSVNLRNSGNGVWSVTVPLPIKGNEFLYKFVVDGKDALGHGVQCINNNNVFTYTPLLNTINYNVTCNNNEVNKGKLNVNNSNKTTNLTLVIPSGYKFVSATLNGQPVSEKDITSIPDSTNYDVHICVEPVYNKLSYKVQCGDTILENNSIEVYNTDYKSNLSKLIPNGYKFSSATDNGKNISETDLQNISNSSVNNIVINVDPIEYSTNVNFYNSETGTLLKTEKLNYTYNKNLNFKDIGKLDGYTFKYVENNGVVLGGTNITEFSGSRVGNINIYESPNENTLSIKIEDSKKVFSTKSIQIANNNGHTNLSDMIPKGYEIANLNINGTYVNVAELNYIPNSTYGNITIKIQPKEYKLIFIDSSTGNKVSSASVYEISDKGSNFSTLVPSGYKVASIEINGVKSDYTLKNIPVAAGDITAYVENQMRTLNVEMLDGQTPIYNASSQVSKTGYTNVASEIPQGYELVSATNNGTSISAKDLSKISNSNNNNIVINVKPVTSTLKVPVYNSKNGWLITTETLNVNVDKKINIEDIAKVDGYKFDYAEVNYARLDKVKTITGVGMKNLKVYLTPEKDSSTLIIKTENGQVLAKDSLTNYPSKKDLTNLIPTGYTLNKLVNDSGDTIETENKQQLFNNNLIGYPSIKNLYNIMSTEYILDNIDSEVIPNSAVNLDLSNNFTAYVSKTQYNVKVNFYDETTGKVIDTKTLTYTYGEPVNMTDFVKTDGYKFDYLNSNGVHILDENMDSFNATWWIQNNNLSVYMLPNTLSKNIKWVNSQNGTTITTSTITGDCNEEVDLNKLCPTGYTIKNINNYNKIPSDDKIELSQIDNMVIQIKPVSKTLKVNYVYNTDNNKTISKTYTGNINQTEDLTSNIPNGYSIKNANIDGKSIDIDTLKKINLSDNTVTIYLEKNPTTINIKCIDSNTNKEISNNNLTTSDSSVDLTTYIPKGYKVTSAKIGNTTIFESALKNINPDKGNVEIYVQPIDITGTVNAKYSNGKLNISFTNATATEVALNINVNGWSLYDMTNEGNGVWEATVDIPSGIDSVEYNFKVDNASWTTGKSNSTQNSYNTYKITQNDKQGDTKVTEIGNGYVKVEYTNANAKTVNIHYLSNDVWDTKQMNYNNGVFSIDVPVSENSTQLEFKFIINGSDWVVANGANTQGSGVYENNIFTYGNAAFATTQTSKTGKPNKITELVKNISNWIKSL